MPQMSKVELHAAIRREHRNGMPMRELRASTGQERRSRPDRLNLPGGFRY
ncbi:hypothetical protein ACWD0A_12620 [Streptomyces sp. NPDC002867]